MPDPLFSLIVAGILVAIGIFIFRPDRGLYWQWQRNNAITERTLTEDALKHIQGREMHGEIPTLESLAGVLNLSPNQTAEVISNLEAHTFIEMDGKSFKLTSAGREYALRIIRAHRVYERFLADKTGYEESEWHTKANQLEHQLSHEDVEKLAYQLGNPTHDPHGDPIPMTDGTVVYPEDRIILSQLDLDSPARIVHMEDEPEAIYAQLVAEGLHVGQEVRLLETSTQRVRFWAGGDEHVLAPILAANITVVKLADQAETTKQSGQPLTNLGPGQGAQVVALSPRIRGAERRRLMDLGLLPGTSIEVEMNSAGGNPIAYRIRGAVIALRKSQAELILVNPKLSKT